MYCTKLQSRLHTLATRFAVAATLALIFGAMAPAIQAAQGTSEEIPRAVRAEIFPPVSEWAKKLSDDSKNAAGKPTKRVSWSRLPIKVDDTTWNFSAHINTAAERTQTTERLQLTVSKPAGASKYAITEQAVVDSYTGLFRESGGTCYPFEGVRIAREGLLIEGGRGEVCEAYIEGSVNAFAFSAPDLTYSYAPPEHAMAVPTGHDFYGVHRLLAKDHAATFSFKPAAVFVECDGTTCETLLAEFFPNLSRIAPAARTEATTQSLWSATWGKAYFDRLLKDRREDPFAHFKSLDYPDRRRYNIFVAREVNPIEFGGAVGAPGSGVYLTYDNWGSWEVEFGVLPRRFDLPDQLVSTIYGYFTAETAANTAPFDLERRDEFQTRWIDVESVKGRVDLAVEDPETLAGDITFGLRLKQDLRELPFFIISFAERSAVGGDRPPPLYVNAIQMDGKDLTWIKTGAVTGTVILPEPMRAGDLVTLRMSYSSRGILNYTPSYSYLSRIGWMPFVSFGDFVDEFELTIRAPSKYQVLGIGGKVSEKVEGDLLVSHWKSNSPVVFPTVIFGRYRSDVPSFDAKKADGTKIPVRVHVDEVSFTQWDIRPGSLRPLAEQAANAINLYSEISGLDYQYDELNLVNDPLGYLYGQAPSSLIYLGSGVFRGEGALAERVRNPQSIARFLKSVTAHEVGHQWWGSRIANANGRNYWFVESLAEYYSALYLEAIYGWKEYEIQVEDWRRSILESRMKASVQNASTLWSGEDGGYQPAVYSKGPYAFHIMREMFKGDGPRGPDGADKQFFEAMRKFAQDLAQRREIVTMDIQDSLEVAFGGVDEDGNTYRADLGWFFDQWIRGIGIPEFAFQYTTRQTEDGNWLIEGKVKQRVKAGSQQQAGVLEGRYYRGRTSITVLGKDRKEYSVPLIIDGAPESTFAFKVPAEPREVIFNKHGELLAFDTLVNRDF